MIITTLPPPRGSSSFYRNKSENVEITESIIIRAGGSRVHKFGCKIKVVIYNMNINVFSSFLQRQCKYLDLFIF